MTSESTHPKRGVFQRLWDEYRLLQIRDKIMIWVAGGWGLWLLSFVFMTNIVLDMIQSPSKSQDSTQDPFEESLEKSRHDREEAHKDFERMARDFKALADRMDQENMEYGVSKEA